MPHTNASARHSRFCQRRALGVTVAALSLAAGLVAACGKTPITSAQALQTQVASRQGAPTRAATTSTIHLTIVAQKPGSADGPVYTPSTNLTVPANALVTITIVNTDLGDATLPADSPFNKVMGVQGGVAKVDGIAYSELSRDKVAHTFTLPSLGVNVPIPGDVPPGQRSITVTFTFRTQGPGSYTWQCMAPCGDGPAGFGGPMTEQGYMMGSMTVVA